MPASPIRATPDSPSHAGIKPENGLAKFFRQGIFSRDNDIENVRGREEEKEKSKKPDIGEDCFNNEDVETNRLEMTLLNMIGKLPDGSLQSSQKYAVSDHRDPENINMIKIEEKAQRSDRDGSRESSPFDMSRLR